MKLSWQVIFVRTNFSLSVKGAYNQKIAPLGASPDFNYRCVICLVCSYFAMKHTILTIDITFDFC